MRGGGSYGDVAGLNGASFAVQRRARFVVSAVFFLTGFCWANWAARIPEVQSNLGLSAGALGIGLFGASVGTVAGLPLAGWLLPCYGSAMVTRLAVLAFCATIVLPTLAPNLLLLFLALFICTVSSGVLEVAMNTQAAAVELAYGRPIMSAFHALYSLGAMAGAGIGGLVAALDVPVLPHLMGVAVALVVAALFATRHLLPVSVNPDQQGVSFARPTRAILVLGIVAFCSVVGEGAMADWSAVYMSRSLGAAAGLAAVGYATFSAAMVAMRFVGDGLNLRFGAVAMVRGGGLLAAGGLGFALLMGQTWAALLGFACVGAGLASVFPAVMSAAGRSPNLPPGLAIAMVATAGYGGGLAGPPLIGFAAQAFSLPLALVTVVVTSAAISLFAPAVGRARLGPALAADNPAALALEDTFH